MLQAKGDRYEANPEKFRYSASAGDLFAVQGGDDGHDSSDERHRRHRQEQGERSEWGKAEVVGDGA